MALRKRLAKAFYFVTGLNGKFFMQRKGVETGRNIVLYGRPLVSRHINSVIRIGERAVICSDSRYTALALHHPVKLSTIRAGASLLIGRDTGLSGVCVVCAQSITIGDEVLLGANALVIDTDFHPTAPLNRRHSDDPEHIGTAPVLIGDNVFIGTQVIVTKGVTIGRDSVVAAGSVVVAGEYAAGSILAGNPARIVGNVYSK